ncbi:RDD family protein [Candidatus Poriferisodalis sp.]|uniref:RDD family protein n=1 Tax=Candidatus Poriferisodalis sp. TaxID=3101277 RepID=UPI003C7040C0
MSEYHPEPMSDGSRRTGWAELGGGETVKLASPAARFGARVFDLLVVLAINTVTLLISIDWDTVLDEAQSATPDFADLGLGPGIWWAWVAVWLVYEVVSVAVWGRTLGKRIVGIKVVHAVSGERPRWGKALLRWLVPSVLAAMPFIPWIGELWWVLCQVSLTWDRVYQGWHDKAAGTLVIKA